MHKIQVLIQDDQYQSLKKLILLTGKKQSAMIRDAIDLLIQKTEQQPDWKQKLMAQSGCLSEQAAKEMQRDIQAARHSWHRY